MPPAPSRPSTSPRTSAQLPAPPRSSSRPPECSQFDFLVGDWDARITRYGPDGELAGELAGTWRAEHRDGGRMLVDEFTLRSPDGATLVFYVTLRTWCPATRRWEMTFLTSHQPLALRYFRGEQRDGELRLEAAGPSPDGREALSRVRFHDIEPDRFAWEQWLSFDGGETWSRGSSLQARRRAAPRDAG